MTEELISHYGVPNVVRPNANKPSRMDKIIAAGQADLDAAAEAERAKVVQWLREQYIVVGFAKVYVGRDLADAIESRAHLGGRD
jgi:hypothetical protein